MAKPKVQAFRTLFFIDGPRPTDEQIAQASELKGTVVFRNSRYVAAEGALEAFDALAGHVPARYREAAEERAALGLDTPAPEPKAAPPVEGSPLVPGRGVAAPVGFGGIIAQAEGAAPVAPAGAAPGASVWKPNA